MEKYEEREPGSCTVYPVLNVRGKNHEKREPGSCSVYRVFEVRENTEKREPESCMTAEVVCARVSWTWAQG